MGIKGEVDLALLTSFKDSLKSADTAFAADEIREPLMSALDSALSNLADMRGREGEALERDILNHLDDVERLAGEVKIHLPDAQKALTERLRDRVIKLAEGVEMNEGRIEQELIFAAERGDINEELSRLASHISQFRSLVKQGEPLGRKLDFLIQEMNRESNTIASKSVDLTLTQKSVDLKSALEKIREQVQNAE